MKLEVTILFTVCARKKKILISFNIYNRPAHLLVQSFRFKPNFQVLLWLSVMDVMK